jgi:hypothetical protein
VETTLSRTLFKAAIFFAFAGTGFAQTQDGGIYVSGLPNNALTADETRDGYELLWNGKDYTGWVLNNSKSNPGAPDAAGNWTIVNLKGVESGDTHKSSLVDSNMLEVVSAGSSLFTKDASFLNFDWKVEWQATVGAAGNAGLLYYYQIAVSTENNPTAAEYQLQNSQWVDEWKSLLTTAGCNYEMTPLLPSRKNSDNSPNWLRAEGHWNQSRIISYQGHCAHYGNGLRLLEYQKGTPAYQTAFSASKYQTYATYPTIHAGSFFLQDHGQPQMKFRNLRVKRLTENPWDPASPYLNKASGKDSTLIDTLAFDQNLFPKGVSNLPRDMIVPRTAVKITTSSEGLAIEFSEAGNYTVSLEDVRGMRYSIHKVRQASQIFLSGKFRGSPRILTIWKGDKKITESIVGVK